MNEALRQFARTKDEAAFSSIVESHAGLVYGTALRRTGDPDIAHDIAQNVFVILSRKAKSLARSGDAPGLGPWLHRTTVFETANHLRKEATRQRTMEEYTAQTRIDSEGEGHGEKAAPILDAVIDKLPDVDRQVILLRFFEEKSFREIGQALGRSEDAVQKRASRALDKLSRLLGRKGIALPAATLSSVLSAQLSQAAPAGLTTTITHAAVTLSAQATGMTILSTITLSIMHAKLQVTAVVTLIALTIPMAIQQNSIATLSRSVAGLEVEKKSRQQAVARLENGARQSGPPSPANIAQPAAPPAKSAAIESIDLDAILEDVIAGMSNMDLTRLGKAMPKLAKLESDQLVELLARLEKKRPPQRIAGQVRQVLFELIAEQDPAYVLAYAVEHRTQFQEAASALRKLAEDDVQAARTWLEEQRERGTLQSKSLNVDAEALLLSGFIAGVAQDDLDTAVNMLNESGSSPHLYAIDKIVQRMLAENTSDHAHILDFSGRLENDENRTHALKRYATSLASFTEFDKAAAFVEILDLPPHDLNDIYKGLASSHTPKGAQKRLEWLVSNSAPEFIDGNVKDYVFQWTILNPARAGEWANTVTGTPYSDAAIEALAEGNLARGQHDVAGEWAARIHNEKRRTRVTERIRKIQSQSGSGTPKHNVIIIEAPGRKN